MERQTDLTLDEIMKELRTQTGEDGYCVCHSDSGLPLCLLANEVGVMAHGGDKAAEAFLCELLLCHNPVNIRATAYSYLKTLPNPQDGSQKAMTEFEADPQNNAIIQMVNERLDEEKMDEDNLPDST